jgi:ribosomal protein S18 acetylase RimI-like enzyme
MTAEAPHHPSKITLTPIVREFRATDVAAVKEFCDEAIGVDYYSIDELTKLQARSRCGEITCSFVLTQKMDSQEQICGIRISYPPGQWHEGKGDGLRPDLWQVPISAVGYFQSLFIVEAWQGQGWGKRMSLASLEALRRLNARAVVCHAWCESPGDSSRLYLRSLGFAWVATHPEYWKTVDYICPRCDRPCLCTADEMIKYLEG